VIRSGALVLAAAACAGLALGLAYGPHEGAVTGAFLLGVGAATLAAAHLAAVRRRRLGRLGRQFGLAVAVALGQIVVALALLSELMFVSDHDAVLLLVTIAVAGAVAARAAQLLARGVLGDVESVRDGLAAVGAGAREPAIATAGRDEVAELAAEANAMVERLAAEEASREATERARRNLVAAVSHDLRTPITSLRLLAEAVEDDLVDGEARAEYLARMRTHIRALGDLIDDLFELSRLEAGEIRWSLERVRMDELIEETVAAMRPAADSRGVAVVAELEGAPATTRANPEKLQRVLFNLIQNAIRHTPADGSVTVRAAARDGAVEIEVADTGDGIAPADRERVFEPFFRGGSDAARTATGAGLGLAISRAIVEAHGGRIWLEEGGAGTRVRVRLPAAAQ
jgi:signal transduction histidine kinase